ncbi:MAG: hypothetical protein MJ158_01935 [Alphaproteobacteria bacterium]|nr:hypothetical protein [Alphaproteobacteria bacterium]
MFENISIVETAISSFNNAALLNPMFLFMGLINIPLLLLVYRYGNDFVSQYGWTKQNINTKISSCFCISVFVLLLMGNFGVLRDNLSILPVMVATIYFITITIITMNLWSWICNTLNKKYRYMLFGICLLLLIFTGIQTWCGMLLQASALISGIIVGRQLSGKKVNTECVVFVIMLLYCFGIVMQPEFFRFGQRGSLTVLHILSLLLFGFILITYFVSKYIKKLTATRELIYLRLRWINRILLGISVLLFILTESILIYLFFLIFMFMTEFISKRYLSVTNIDYVKHLYAYGIILFGIITMCPLISALGCLILPKSVKIDLKKLLTML